MLRTQQAGQIPASSAQLGAEVSAVTSEGRAGGEFGELARLLGAGEPGEGEGESSIGPEELFGSAGLGGFMSALQVRAPASFPSRRSPVLPRATRARRGKESTRPNARPATSFADLFS